jgi:CRISPR-associated protein Cas6/Cse3/CasE subtype I-E
MKQVMIPLKSDVIASIQDKLFGRKGRFGEGVDMSSAHHRLACGRFSPDCMPRPFAVANESIGTVFHGYHDGGLDALREQPIVNDGWEGLDPFDWNRAMQRDVPEFAVGQQLLFRLACSPSIRHFMGERRVESDAFLYRRSRDKTVTKVEAYEWWLSRQLGSDQTDDFGGPVAPIARLVEGTFQVVNTVTVDSMRPVYKECGERSTDKNWTKFTKALLTGAIVVDDPVRFRDLLKKGIGRNRAYGMGMMLLSAR